MEIPIYYRTFTLTGPRPYRRKSKAKEPSETTEKVHVILAEEPLLVPEGKILRSCLPQDDT
jgi:hypothetical protein